MHQQVYGRDGTRLIGASLESDVVVRFRFYAMVTDFHVSSGVSSLSVLSVDADYSKGQSNSIARCISHAHEWGTRRMRVDWLVYR